MSKVKSVENPPNAKRVVESLRDTGYVFNTAVADVIDNSIAANATIVRVDIGFSAFEDKLFLKIADNGDGMDEAGLIDALRYGSSTRPSPKSLGKFGMGLKTASTAFCRAVSLVSKVKGEPIIRKVTLDLDYIQKCNKWELLLSDPSDEEREDLESISEETDSGTIVLWEKIDRIFSRDYVQGKARDRALDRICEELSFHLSAVYGRFLDPEDTRAENVQIYLNGDEIKPWDPFCKAEEETKKIGSEQPLVVVDENDNEIASATLQAYVIPRPADFSSVDAKKWAMGTGKGKEGFNDLQGIYVYRENRLIQLGGWMNMFVKEPHLSYARIEFSFDHRLDDAFKIDIKKSRITLAPELKDVLRDYLNGPRKAASDRYRNKEEERVKAGSATMHRGSNNVIDGRADKIDAVKPDSVNEKKGTVTLTNMDPVQVTYKIRLVKPEDPHQRRVITQQNTTDGVLWEPTFTDEMKVAVVLNERHDFYRKIYYPNRENGDLIIGLDSLFWSLAQLELKTMNEEAKNRYEELRYRVSRDLRELLDEIPDPEVE